MFYDQMHQKVGLASPPFMRDAVSRDGGSSGLGGTHSKMSKDAPPRKAIKIHYTNDDTYEG